MFHLSGKGTQSRNCSLRAQQKCYKCNRSGHHTLICNGSQPSGTRNSSAQNTADSTHQSVLSSATPDTGVSNSTEPAAALDPPAALSNLSTSYTTKQTVLLQTALVSVTATSGTTRQQARALLDSASQRTFLSRRLANALQLAPLSHEFLSVATFGAMKLRDMPTDVVECNLCLKGGSLL